MLSQGAFLTELVTGWLIQTGVLIGWGTKMDNFLRMASVSGSDEALAVAINLIRNEIDQLIERAEALDLHAVVGHLTAASQVCLTGASDSQET